MFSCYNMCIYIMFHVYNITYDMYKIYIYITINISFIYIYISCVYIYILFIIFILFPCISSIL